MAEHARKTQMTFYSGWILPEDERKRLLEAIKPAYTKVVAHHVTLEYGVTSDAPLPTESTGQIVGCADDGAGVQALVVRIGGTTRRPDGNNYHVTWSLAEGRKPQESNDVISAFGWTPLDEYWIVRLEPKLMGR